MGHMPPSPSMGHPGLPDLGTVDGTPMKYTRNTRTTVIDTMTKLMKLVPNLIGDWQESSGRWYTIYPALGHLLEDRAYCCLSGIIWALSRCYNELWLCL